MTIRPCRICGELTLTHPSAHYCTPCSCNLRGLHKNIGIKVKAAIKRGVLADPKTLRCADCQGKAIEYDHRDYGKPLEVDPVCRPCNWKRGPPHSFGYLQKQQQ